MTQQTLTGFDFDQLKRNNWQGLKKAEASAYRMQGWDMLIQTWPNRPAMLKALHKQNQKPAYRTNWKACIEFQAGD